MIKPRPICANHSEHGVALILALLALLLITALSLAMLTMTNSETWISSNFRSEQVAYFAARGGIEEARDRLRVGAPGSLSASLPSGLPGTTNGVLYVTNPIGSETVTPWATTSGSNQSGNNNGNFGNGTASSGYADPEICREVSCTGGTPGGSPWYVSTSASTNYASSPPLVWKWVRVSAKTNRAAGTTAMASVDGTTSGNRVCWNGTNEVVVPAGSTCQQANGSYFPAYTLTSLAVSNGSRRMIQAEVVSSAFPPLPGAMIFDGPTPTYAAPNSNAFGVSGNDANQGPSAGAGCGAAVNQPALGGYDAAAVTSLTSSIPRPPKYTGTGGSPSVQNVSSSLGPLATVDGLTNLVNQVTNSALPANIYAGNTTSLTNPGTTNAPVINVVQGDLTVGGGFSGTGILVVTGTLTMSGNPSYDGVILVVGKGVLNKNGGGNGTMNGSILVANLYNSSNNLIPLGANNPPGPPTINWNGGGNATIQYDSCWVSAVTQNFPYKIIAVRELMY